MVELSHRLPSASLTSTPRRVGFQFSVVFWLSACLTMWACGDGPAGPGDTTPPQVASVVLTPASATLVSLGETVQLAASARDGSGNPMSGKTFTWSSSDGGVATVSSSGLVTAVADGSATISATGDAMSGTATVDVTIPTPDVAGYWTGLTSQGLSISFHVTDQDVLDQLSVRIRASIPGSGSCTATFSQKEDVMVTGGVFATSVSNPAFNTLGGDLLSVAMRGSFSTSSSGTGTIDGYSGSFFIICGGWMFLGSGGTLWGDITWDASPGG